jgi:DNA-binding NtrC family response regulator
VNGFPQQNESSARHGKPPKAALTMRAEEPPPPTPIHVLLVSPSDSDCEQLRQTLSGTRWQVLHARSCADATALLAGNVVPVIIRDLECCDLGCVHSIRCLQVGVYPAPLIVVAPAPSFRLWEEVIDRGGFEVLSKPFDMTRVRRVLEFAHRHWLAGEIRRRWERFDYPE